MHNYSGATINANAININGGPFLNEGTVNVTADVSFNGCGPFTNYSTGIINCVNFTNASTLTNNGRINLTGNFTNTGTFTVGAGSRIRSVDWTNTATIIGPGSGGCGAFAATGNTTNTGSVDPNSANVDICDLGHPPSPFIDSDTGNQNSASHCTCTALPIELLLFTAEAVETKVYLKWITATETNNDHFTIERSQTGTGFEPIATIKGAGTSSRELSYSYIDETPLAGLSYYKLKQTDYDGQFAYFPMVAVDKNRSNSGSLFPNPTSGSFALQLGKQTAGNLLVVLVDVLGQEVYSSTISLADPSASTLITISPDEKLPSGVYYVIASSNDVITKHKLIISK